ncbi:MAG: glycerate kinase [Gammaproteobacteria bacterium]|nr:glycerate kinase [Gammaproteobacteria bacterium]
MASAPLVIAPNAFKGTLSATAAAAAMVRGLERVHPDRPRFVCPLPDGGDGTLEVLAARLNATPQQTVVTTADGMPRAIPFALWEARRGPVALIESAAVTGLPVAGAEASMRTTRGLGEWITQLLDRGVRRFCVGLGGSATWDAGTGMLAALGARFDGNGDPRPAHLAAVRRVCVSALDPRLKDCRWTILVDVNNPLLGADGAALYARQKGVDAAALPAWDAAIAHVAGQLEQSVRRGLVSSPGAGAAGGLGFAFAFLGARLLPGAPFLARLAGLDRAIAASAAVFTGEGACDRQTAAGKGPRVVADLAARHGRPAIVICGRIDPSFAVVQSRFSQSVALMPAANAADAVADAVEWVLRQGHF